MNTTNQKPAFKIINDGVFLQLNFTNIPRDYLNNFIELYDKILNDDTSIKEVIEFIDDEIEIEEQQTKKIMYNDLTDSLIKELNFKKQDFNWLINEFKNNDLTFLLNENINEVIEELKIRKTKDGTTIKNATIKACLWNFLKFTKHFNFKSSDIIKNEAVKFNQLVDLKQNDKDNFTIDKANNIIQVVQDVYDENNQDLLSKFILNLDLLDPPNG